MNDQEFNQMVLTVCTDFSGQIDELYEAVGMLEVGRLFGWKVMRLVSTRRAWSTATKLFGDPKLLMPERGPLWKKSVGLNACDAAQEYWEVVKGHVALPYGSKKEISKKEIVV